MILNILLQIIFFALFGLIFNIKLSHPQVTSSVGKINRFRCGFNANISISRAKIRYFFFNSSIQFMSCKLLIKHKTSGKFSSILWRPSQWNTSFYMIHIVISIFIRHLLIFDTQECLETHKYILSNFGNSINYLHFCDYYFLIMISIDNSFNGKKISCSMSAWIAKRECFIKQRWKLIFVSYIFISCNKTYHRPNLYSLSQFSGSYESWVVPDITVPSSKWRVRSWMSI
jgi:hypothetical protein